LSSTNGPTIEEIEAELDRYRKETEEKIQKMLEEAHERARAIEEEGKAVAFNLIQESKEKAKREEETARINAEQIVERAKLEVERMIKEADMRVGEIEHEAYQKGYDAGREVGFKKGQSEVRRLIDRIGTIVGQAIDVREEIIAASEKQMVDMILMVARKVIKDEVAERKEVVLNNIREALKRIKDRDRVDIRVNFADLELTTAHKDELIKMMESLRKVNIYEDSRIDRGGCIIETDVGSIDARISTQLKEIEEAIRNAQPMTGR
jgi:flagellar assembly protein FliH